MTSDNPGPDKKPEIQKAFVFAATITFPIIEKSPIILHRRDNSFY